MSWQSQAVLAGSALRQPNRTNNPPSRGNGVESHWARSAAWLQRCPSSGKIQHGLTGSGWWLRLLLGRISRGVQREDKHRPAWPVDLGPGSRPRLGIKGEEALRQADPDALALDT